MNTADYLLERGVDHQPVLLVSGEYYTYGELKAAAARVAGELDAAGVQAGDRVGILSDNSVFWVASYLAILKAGAVAVPFPTVSTPADFQRRQQVVSCHALCVDTRLLRRFAAVLAKELAVIDSSVLNTPGPRRWDGPGAFDAGRDAALMLTSGTTALPRAVRITHRNIQANTNSIIEYLELDRDDRIVVVLPFYYCFGASLLHTHLRAGGSLAVCNTFAYPETALDLLEASRSTGIAGVPSTFQTLLRNTSLASRKFPFLRKVQQAGGKLAPAFVRDLMRILPDTRIFTMYGQTEGTARLSYLPPEYLETKPGSIGKGVPGVSLRVVNETGEDVRPGEVGEIVATGENISPGYFDDPAGSAEKFRDGMLRTGDLATVDEDGFLFVVDRKSDFIKSLGHRVSSQEVEAAIVDQFPDVVTAAAVGQPDPVQGEAIVVFVTLRDGSSATPEEILRRCRATMARHMVPKAIVVKDSLPVNANGKIMKAVLRQQLAEAAGGDC